MRCGSEAEEILDRVLIADKDANGIDASSRVLTQQTGWDGVAALREEANIVGIYSQIVNLGDGLKIAGLPCRHAMCVGEERQHEAEQENLFD